MWDTLSPIALFASTQDFLTKSNHLVPVAIQMDFTPGSVHLRISRFSPNIKMQILFSGLHTFCRAPVGRTYLYIKTVHLW